MNPLYRLRRVVLLLIMVAGAITTLLLNPDLQQVVPSRDSPATKTMSGGVATTLGQLEVKGRAPKSGYTRSQFGDGWATVRGCDTRNIILHRDLKNTAVNEKCQVTSGTLDDPYTDKTIAFTRSAATSGDVQIDHVVALSDAWQKGAGQLTHARREALANDPLELLAVDGSSNQQKSDGDAATWLPPNKAFRCQYVARQVAVKKKYALWVTAAEKEAILRVIASCPEQQLPG